MHAEICQSIIFLTLVKNIHEILKTEKQQVKGRKQSVTLRKLNFIVFYKAYRGMAQNLD